MVNINKNKTNRAKKTLPLYSEKLGSSISEADALLLIPLMISKPVVFRLHGAFFAMPCRKIHIFIV